MVSVFSNLRGRQDSRIVRDVTGPGLDTSKDGFDVGVSSDADTMSLEARNEKELQIHPNEVTSSAQEGVKKAEAAALIWGQKTVYAIYAWYASLLFLNIQVYSLSLTT